MHGEAAIQKYLQVLQVHGTDERLDAREVPSKEAGL